MPPFQYLPYLLPLIIAVVIQGILAFYAWRHHRTPGAKSFTIMMVALCIWSVGYTLELLSGANLPLKVFWASGKYLGVVLAPLAWFTFAIEYTGRETWLTPRRLALLSIVPLLTFTLAMTNGVHNLVWSQEQVVAAGPFLALKVAFGPWFWVHTAYSYMLLLLGAILLVQALLHRPHLYQGQMTGLLLALAAPWLGNAISIFGFNPVPDLDLTPLAFTVTGLMLAWSLFRFRLLNLAPVARETVVESMSDGMIVLDMQAQVVDINPAAQQMIGVPASQVIGRKAAEVFGARPDLVEHYRDVTFVTTIASNLPATLSGDETRLRQILINLIGNAIKFTKIGTIRTRLYCPDAEHWAMEVTDTGLGIPKEAQQYIFEPFRQVDGSITREHGGTGLGLSIVKRLTDLLGGQVILESEIGQGSTFTVVLPLAPCRSQQNGILTHRHGDKG